MCHMLNMLLAKWLRKIVYHMVTYFGFSSVLLGGRSSNCLRYIRYNEIGMKGSGRKLLQTQGASCSSGASIPIFLDALFTKMVHAFQHDRVPEEVIAYGTGQFFLNGLLLALASHFCKNIREGLSFNSSGRVLQVKHTEKRMISLNTSPKHINNH